jgi:hypothetical protein
MIQGARNPYIDHPEYVALVFQCTGLVPVTLTDFRAIKANDKVILTWQATHEANFREYQVERSTNGIDFTSIGSVHGQNLFNYNYNDNSLPNKSVVYYRLKLIDADGKAQYSNIVSVRLNNNFSNAIVYPNPTLGKLNIQLINPLMESSNVTVIDVTGRKVLSSKAEAGTVNVLLNVASLPAGRYIVTINNSAEVIKESFVVGK